MLSRTLFPDQEVLRTVISKAGTSICDHEGVTVAW